MQKSSSLIHSLAGLAAGLVLLQTATAATYLWDVASPGANNWDVNANWLPNTGNPGAADTAIFGLTGTSPDAFTVNNVVSVNTTVAALSYTNNGAGLWHVTQIPAGVTLTVSGATVMGGWSSAGAVTPTSVALYDAGTLSLNGNLSMGNSGSANTISTVDFSGLSNFVCNAASGTVWAGIGNRSLVAWKLATVSNSITAATLNNNALGTSSSGTANTTLGAGTNIFNVGTFLIGGGRLQSTVSFPAGSAGGGLRIRGPAGTDASLCNMTLGNHNTGGSGSTAAGTLSLDGYPVDIKLGTLSLGLSSSGPSGNSPGNGTVSFDTGTIFANNIAMGVSSGTTNFVLANGTINVGAAGTLTVGTGGMSLANQSALSGAATGTLNVNGGAVICSNNIIKTTVAGTGTINLTGGSLTMKAGVIGTAAVPIDTLSMGDSALTLAVGATTTNVSVTTLTMTSTTNNTINISTLPVIVSYPAQFPLIRYGSGSSDCLLGSLPPGYVGSLVNGVGSVDLLITSGPITIRPLVWNGLPTGDWNTITANWLYLGSPTAYSQADFATFDDTAGGATTVNLTTALTPGSLTVSNNIKNYTFNGSGSLGGAVSLVKAGSGQLTLANSGVNTFSNGVSIQDGTLLLSGSADRLPTAAGATLAEVSGAILDLNNLNQTLQSLNGGGFGGGEVKLGSANLTVVGGGTYGGVISGTGQLIKTNFVTGGTLNLTNANTYTGGTIIGGFTNNTTLAVGNTTGSGTGSSYVRVLTNGTFALGTGGPGGSVAAGVITNDGTVSLNRSEDFTLTNIILGAGGLNKANTNTVSVTGSNGYAGQTTIGNGFLRISNPGALGSGTAYVQNGPTTLQLAGGITFTNTLRVSNKPSGTGVWPCVENFSGSNTLSGPLELNQNGSFGWLFYATSGRLLLSGANTPLDSTLTSQNTTRTLWLRGDAVGEWNGSINDNAAPNAKITLRKDGLGTWTLGGANTYTAPTVVSNGTLLVNGSLVAASAVTVAGGTLGGTGTINGPVVVNPEGTLAPGASIGTLTVNNDLTLNGITIMEVSSTGGDSVAGINNLTMGGTLQVVVNGTLGGYEVFKLFAATNYLGDFTYDLPTLPSPLAWSNSIAVDGTLRVTGGTAPPPQPTLGPVTRSGTNLVVPVPTVSGANYVLQSATNLTPTIIWRNESTNAGTGGTLNLNVPIDPAAPRKFVRVWVY